MFGAACQLALAGQGDGWRPYVCRAAGYENTKQNKVVAALTRYRASTRSICK